MKRRDFVRTMCYGGLATFGLPVVNFAQVAQNGRFVFILLRGGFDGLAALVPYGDPDYRALRGTFAYNASDLGRRPARGRGCDGNPASHAQSLRRPGDSGDRTRSSGRLF